MQHAQHIIVIAEDNQKIFQMEPLNCDIVTRDVEAEREPCLNFSDGDRREPWISSTLQGTKVPYF
jgi:hypothetical protein